MALPRDMYQCQVKRCGYIYQPDLGEPKTDTPPGTRFSELPNGWSCPYCQAAKSTFRPLAGPGSVLVDGP